MTRNLTLLTLIGLMAFSQGVQAQNVMRSALGMAGSSQQVNAKGQQYFISQSIGQVGITGTLSKNGRTVRQGFQQPPEGLTIRESTIGDLKAQVYPNPTDQWLNISIQEDEVDDIQIWLFDNLGRLILNQRYQNTSTINLPMSGRINGAYIIKVVMGDKQLTSTILKQ